MDAEISRRRPRQASAGRSQSIGMRLIPVAQRPSSPHYFLNLLSRRSRAYYHYMLHRAYYSHPQTPPVRILWSKPIQTHRARASWHPSKISLIFCTFAKNELGGLQNRAISMHICSPQNFQKTLSFHPRSPKLGLARRGTAATAPHKRGDPISRPITPIARHRAHNKQRPGCSSGAFSTCRVCSTLAA